MKTADLPGRVYQLFRIRDRFHGGDSPWNRRAYTVTIDASPVAFPAAISKAGPDDHEGANAQGCTTRRSLLKGHPRNNSWPFQPTRQDNGLPLRTWRFKPDHGRKHPLVVLDPNPFLDKNQPMFHRTNMKTCIRSGDFDYRPEPYVPGPAGRVFCLSILVSAAVRIRWSPPFF